MLSPSVTVSLPFFFFNDTATTEIYTLSLHDALPISRARSCATAATSPCPPCGSTRDRKSTRLNSSHRTISYAVFCLKKKKVEEPVLTIDILKYTHHKSFTRLDSS